ncbi:MAG TPA: geranylgeranylglycerol-phosphate geranylgeranyltransferase [Flavipsychrobacter sp.]|nr:geranylgeranylglycerol-phosphate geranylgeranyltransferase [Flavipsychrobacter sp.]
MSAWLTLIRWKNLLIIFATQLFIWACVFLPASSTWNHLPKSLLTPINFLLLASSTVLIAAAGYIINDYFDIRIDLINKPDKMVLEKQIPRRMAIILHGCCNLLALALAWYVAAQRTAYEWLFVQLLCTILLWFYSTTFKRKFMIGNVTVALLTALTILTLLVYEPSLHPFLTQAIFIKESNGATHLNPVWLLGGYAYFAFILTWMREIVKDMEDLKGDFEEGCETMPIRWGLRRASYFTQALACFALLPLVLAVPSFYHSGNFIMAIYTMLALVLPLFFWIFNLHQKATAQHYARSSSQLKLIMVAGIGSLIINLISEWIQ